MRLPQTPFILEGMMGRGGDGGVARWLGKCGQTGGGLVDWKNRVPPQRDALTVQVLRHRLSVGPSAAGVCQGRAGSAFAKAAQGCAPVGGRRGRRQVDGRVGGQSSQRVGEEEQTLGTQVLVETLNCPNAIAK